jgi:hypothetical protein
VNLPGALKGISNGGALLYTVGPHWKPDTNWSYDGAEWLDAAAYDGVEVHAVDSFALPPDWPHPLLVKDADLFLGRPAGTNSTSSVIEAWKMSIEGRLAQLGQAKVPAPAEDLVNFGDLLAARSGNQLNLFGVANPAAPVDLGEGGLPGCLWFDLRSADGAVDRGVWLPLGLYGVAEVPVLSAP